jgi:hypothetical protein
MVKAKGVIPDIYLPNCLSIICNKAKKKSLKIIKNKSPKIQETLQIYGVYRKNDWFRSAIAKKIIKTNNLVILRIILEKIIIS